MCDINEINDPVEKVIAQALADAGIKFITPDSETGLDFRLIDADILIEVKRFHSNRIAEQMSRAENVIAIQGLKAAIEFRKMINPG